MGLSEMLEKSSPIQVKRKKENASAFKSLANRNTELVDENKELKEEIERLKVLCGKYEEEHNTAFQMWKQGVEKLPTYEEKIELQERIDKVIEYIEHENFKRNILVGVRTKKYTRDILNNILEILKGEDKE